MSFYLNFFQALETFDESAPTITQVTEALRLVGVNAGDPAVSQGVFVKLRDGHPIVIVDYDSQDETVRKTAGIYGILDRAGLAAREDEFQSVVHHVTWKA